LVTFPDNIGYSFLAALREIGESKLLDLVNVSGATGAKKTNAEKYAKEIVDCIDCFEKFTGKKGSNLRNVTGKKRMEAVTK